MKIGPRRRSASPTFPALSASSSKTTALASESLPGGLLLGRAADGGVSEARGGLDSWPRSAAILPAAAEARAGFEPTPWGGFEGGTRGAAASIQTLGRGARERARG